jgi:hypothetical protein
MGHISGNKIRIGSIEVTIDREYPGEEPVNFPHIVIHFYGCSWPLKRENAKISFKVSRRVEYFGVGCTTQPQNFIARPHYGCIHPHEISDRYDFPNPFKIL